MRPARLRDSVALTRLLLDSLTHGRAPWVRRLHRAAIAPGAYITLLLTPGIHHRDRRFMATLVPRSAGTLARLILRLLVGVACLGPGFLLWKALLFLTAVAMALFLIPATPALVLMEGAFNAPLIAATVLGGSVLAYATSLGRSTWQVPPTRWILSTVEPAPDGDGLDALGELVRGLVPAGDTIGVIARTPEHAAAYRRLGFSRAGEGSLLMTACVPAATDRGRRGLRPR